MRPILLLPALLLLLGIASARPSPAQAPAPPFELRPGDDFDAAREGGFVQPSAGGAGVLAASLRAYAGAAVTIDSYAILEARERVLLTLAIEPGPGLAEARAEAWDARGLVATIVPGTAAHVDARPGETLHLRIRFAPGEGPQASLRIHATGTVIP